jgi:hypothetical protein
VRWLIRRAHGFLYFGTCLVVWLFHGRVFRTGGFRFGSYWNACWLEFSQAVSLAAGSSMESAGPAVESVS